MSLLTSLVFAALLANLLPDVQAIRPAPHCDVYSIGGPTKDTHTVTQGLVLEKPQNIDPPSQCIKPGSELYGFHAKACDLGGKGYPKIEPPSGTNVLTLAMSISCKDCGNIEVAIKEYCKPVLPPSLK